MLVSTSPLTVLDIAEVLLYPTRKGSSTKVGRAKSILLISKSISPIDPSELIEIPG